MSTFWKRCGLSAGAGLAVLCLATPGARAQIIRPGFNVPNSMSPRQAIINQGLTGQVFPGISPVTNFPYANPLFNPFNNPLRNPFINPYINPAINPNALNNYYNPLVANPISPWYQGGPNPITGTPGLNPYLTATMTSSAYSPYGGYGGDGGGGYPGSYGGYYESELGGYLRGTADLVTAQGKWLKDQQQAAIIKEQSKQEQLKTRRMMFDQYLYIREKTPTFEQERQRFWEQDLSRSLNNTPIGEVRTGQALNNILTDLAPMVKKNGKGPNIPLDQDVLNHLNLTPAGAGNPGLLKNEGRLTWPLALRDEEYKNERELLNNLAPEAIRQAINGKVDAGTLREMGSALDRLHEKLATNIRELTPNQYIEARRFLGFFDDAYRTLQRPDAGDYFGKKYTAKGGTVADLVKFMLDRGLTFAPAVTGDEPAYLAVHHALSAYDAGLKAQSATASEKER
jgi:hypothetical protein